MLKKVMCLIACGVIFLTPCTTAFANSAQTSWSGVSASGAAVVDKDCPLVVENEKLVFDIPEFPQSYYDSTKDYLNYSASVTAEYTFKNTADYKVDATLVFPFGAYPSYVYYDEETGYNADTEKFDILVNGKATKKKLRHTFVSLDEFDKEKDISRLKDGFKEDEFFSPNTPVKVYVFEAKGIDESLLSSACVIAPFSADPDKTRIVLSDCTFLEYKDDKVFAGLWTDIGTSFTMYVIGEDIDYTPEWTIYENGMQENEIDGEVELLFTDKSTFKDIALMFHRQDGGISESDWYNAVIDNLNYYEYDLGFIGSDYEFLVTDELMRWYEYSLSAEPNQTITNTVTAPLYPTIDEGYEPPKYEYTYLLSPAQSWKEFGELDIEINTPYNLLKSNLGKFSNDGEKYTLHLDSLPKGECEFTLCSVKKPKKIHTPIVLGVPLEIIILIAIVFVILIAVIIVLAVNVATNRKKKND